MIFLEFFENFINLFGFIFYYISNKKIGLLSCADMLDEVVRGLSVAVWHTIVCGCLQVISG